MKLNFKEFYWIREPKQWKATLNGTVKIVTEPHTDLWQRTYYHFRNDNAPCYVIDIDEKYFSFTVKVDFKEAHHRFDQAGIIIYLTSESWLKASVEYQDESFNQLGTVVTNQGYSDWSTTKIDSKIREIWYRLSRRDDDFRVECSFDGINFEQMRITHLINCKDTIRTGIYACSPEDSSFKAVFSDMKIEECKWDKHDGQQPDK